MLFIQYFLAHSRFVFWWKKTHYVGCIGGTTKPVESIQIAYVVLAIDLPRINSVQVVHKSGVQNR